MATTTENHVEPKKTKQIKVFAWFNGQALVWRSEEVSKEFEQASKSIYGLVRAPSEDKIIEIEEN